MAKAHEDTLPVLRDPLSRGFPLLRAASFVLRAARRPLLWQDAAMRLRLHLGGLRRKTLDLPNGRLHLWVGGEGEGPPLLLLQGFGTDAQWQWFRQMPFFAKRHRVIVPDLLFFGASHSDAGDHRLEFQTETMVQLLDALELPRVHVAGISYGGLLAWDLTDRYPSRVDKLALIASPGSAFVRDDHEHILRTFGVDELQHLLVPTNPDGVQRLIEVAWHCPPTVPRFALRDAYEHMFTDRIEDKRRLVNHVTDMMQIPGVNDRHVSHPTLLLWGEFDRIFPLELARRLRRKLGAHAQLRILWDTAHAPNQERPDDFNRLLAEFLGEL